ncbi:unnamed protein product [Oikopleura dioica]|uniref:Uncharacterized protein n=1 Tax=Oikopleura dioica TaxID=34765 RepID=E4XPU1_OIKDI|nr:unnamed protein product [Oikopleura dioica]
MVELNFKGCDGRLKVACPLLKSCLEVIFTWPSANFSFMTRIEEQRTSQG